MEPELSQFARSRRAGILLVSGGTGLHDYVCGDCAGNRAGAGDPGGVGFGILPLAVGIGYFLDAALIHRDMKDDLRHCSL